MTTAIQRLKFKHKNLNAALSVLPNHNSSIDLSILFNVNKQPCDSMAPHLNLDKDLIFLAPILFFLGRDAWNGSFTKIVCIVLVEEETHIKRILGGDRHSDGVRRLYVGYSDA